MTANNGRDRGAAEAANSARHGSGCNLPAHLHASPSRRAGSVSAHGTGASGLPPRPITDRTLDEDHLAALETLARIALRDGRGR